MKRLILNNFILLVSLCSTLELNSMITAGQTVDQASEITSSSDANHSSQPISDEKVIAPEFVFKINMSVTRQLPGGSVGRASASDVPMLKPKDILAIDLSLGSQVLTKGFRSLIVIFLPLSSISTE